MQLLRFVGEALGDVPCLQSQLSRLLCSAVVRAEFELHVLSKHNQVIDCLASDLRATHNLHKLQLLDCMRTKLLQCPRGSPGDNSSKVNAALSSRTTFFHNMPQRLNSGWTHLHYAAARNDLYMIKNLLKARANVNTKTLGADKDFFLRPALSPLHVWPLGLRRQDTVRDLV